MTDMTDMTDMGGIWPIAAIFIFILWLFVLRDTVSGVFLRVWHREGERKQVSLFVVRLCWFLFVLSTSFLGMGAYLLWECIWRIARKRRNLLRKRAQREKDAVAAIAAASAERESPAELSAAADDVRSGLRQVVIWGFFCLSVLVFLVAWQEVLGVMRALVGVWELPILAVVFSLAGLFGAPLLAGIYNPVCGGFFVSLVQRRLPALSGLSRAQRQERFSAQYAAVCSEHSFERIHNILASFVLMLVIYPLVAWIFTMLAEVETLFEPLGGLAPEWLVHNESLWMLWMFGIVAFKVFIWDAVAAWLLYNLMRKGGGTENMGQAHA